MATLTTNMNNASSPTESSVGYSAEEIAEMKNIFNEYDTDGSGHLNAHEFTNALQLMEYKYNESFVISVLQLVFDEKWESKKNNLLFEDFMDFMSEFEPVHYEVIEKIEEKLRLQNITNVSIDSPKITNLLKYAQMQNGSLLLTEIDCHLSGLQSMHTLQSISENEIMQKECVSEINNATNAENNTNTHQKMEEMKKESNEIIEIVQEQTSNDHKSISNMSNNELMEWINIDKTFNTTVIRRECCEIIQSQNWNGNDMIEALKLKKKNEIILLFKNIQNYQYLVQSLQTTNINTSDINCEELINNLEMIKQSNESMPDTIEEYKSEELKPLSPHRPPLLNVGRTLSVTSKTMIDSDDSEYTQNVWKQILRFFDENNDGTIDKNEMAPALRSLGIDVNETKLSDLISKMDSDQSGSIDYHEFKAYYNSLFKSKISKGLDWKYVQNIFEKYDSDKSGFLDVCEFTFALKKLCAYISDCDIKSILHLIDASGNHQIEFEEFVSFLESGHAKAEWVLKKLIRASIPSPIEYLTAFKGVPQHFRKSELSELAKHNSFKMSERLKPQVDIDGITLTNIKTEPKTGEIHRKYKSFDSDSKERDEQYYLQNVRIFTITECEGVPLPQSSIASRIIHRKVRVCLYSNDRPISNVFTVPALWKATEEDQWQFGGTNVWKESMSSAVSEWNSFCVSVPHNLSEKLELYIELCVTLKSENKSSENELLCGWSRLEIHNTNVNVANKGIHRNHKLRINGGTLNNESKIDTTDIRNDTKTSLSFRKLKQALTSIQSIVKITEESFHNFSSKHKQCCQWIPHNIITPVSSGHIFQFYYELMADEWCRNQPFLSKFQFSNPKNKIYQTLLLFIVDRPNLLCVLIDEWKLKCDKLWRIWQKNDTDLMKNEFKILLRQFVPLLVHQTLVQKQLTSLNQERLSLVRNIVRGNVLHILNGNKPSSSIPLIYTPFTTDLFVS